MNYLFSCKIIDPCAQASAQDPGASLHQQERGEPERVLQHPVPGPAGQHPEAGLRVPRPAAAGRVAAAGPALGQVRPESPRGALAPPPRGRQVPGDILTQSIQFDSINVVSQIDDALSQFEAADFQDYSEEFYDLPREFNILGSCLFHKVGLEPK